MTTLQKAKSACKKIKYAYSCGRYSQKAMQHGDILVTIKSNAPNRHGDSWEVEQEKQTAWA
jgi:hypothetical protein